MGLIDLKIIASSYAHPLVLLFAGGFIIASAMESSGLHKRIALKILSFQELAQQVYSDNCFT